MNRVQLNSVLERLAVVAISYAVGAGYIAPGDEQTYVAIAVAVLTGVVALWNNRQKRIAEKASDAGLEVIAPDDIANKTTRPGIFSSEYYGVGIKSKE